MNKQNLINIIDLGVGHFGSLNGSIVYRYEPNHRTGWLPGIWLVEKHNHLPIYDALTQLDVNGKYYYLVEPIEFPDKKHIDNAICMLRKAMKDDKLDGLTYVDNMDTLKEYLRKKKNGSDKNPIAS